jgi:serralysin
VFSNDDLWTVTGTDYVGDFEQGIELLDLGQVDAVAGGSDDSFTFIGTGAFSGAAGELRYSTSGSIGTIEGDVDGDMVADLVILIESAPALTGLDFVL